VDNHLAVPRQPSASSVKTTRSKGSSNRTTPEPSSESLPQRRDHNARISFFDPGNQATLDRMLSVDAGGVAADIEEENTQATMASVEEMLEGYEWASDTMLGNSRARGTVDQIEARLLDELTALEKVRCLVSFS
jgi:exocyst complex component 1